MTSRTVLDLRKDTTALKQLSDLEELVDVPIERGGVYFSDWERTFIRDVRRQFDDTLDFSPKQREKITEVWHAVDLRKRGCLHVCMKHASWRFTTSWMFGHSEDCAVDAANKAHP